LNKLPALKVKRKKPSQPALGFTLVELLVVITSIALLLSILISSLGKARTASMRIKCAHNLRQINIAVNLYLNGNNDTYPCTNDPRAPGIWLWMGRGWRAFVEPYLGDKVGPKNDSVLFCPQDNAAKTSGISGDDFGYTSYAYSMAFYHSPQQIDTMDCTEKHQEQWDENFVQNSVPQRSCDVSKSSGKILIGEWDSNHSRIDVDSRWWHRGWWCWQGARNYLFADGHTAFIEAVDIRKANDGNPNPNLTIHGVKGLDCPR